MSTRLPNLKADVFRASHYASVVAILGSGAPKVEAFGQKFYNVDRWTARLFVKQMCVWAKQHPGEEPSKDDISIWVNVANSTNIPYRKIVTAAIPPDLTLHVAHALTGGAYHEAFHTKYSCRRFLKTVEMADIILPRWRQVPDWSVLETMLQEWNNVVEDIRIERCGNAEYPGIRTQMVQLQDFILNQETDTSSTLAIAMMTFRDVGLGYASARQDLALQRYQERNLGAYQMVMHGPLKPLLEEAIALPATDDLGCIRLAFDIVALLHHLAKKGTQPQEPSESPDNPLESQPSSDGASFGSTDSESEDPGEGEGEGSSESEDGEEEGLIPASGMDMTPSDEGDSRHSNGFNGHRYDEAGVSSFWDDIASNMIEDESARLHDYASALEEKVKAGLVEQIRQCQPDEATWQPYSLHLDTVDFVKPTAAGQAKDAERAKELLASVKKESVYIRQKIQRLIQSRQETHIAHGVRRGQAISERMLVDTYASIQENRYPQRAYYKRSTDMGVSFAAAIIIDESESMCWNSKLIDATRCLMALTEPLDSLKFPVMVAGFRDGKAGSHEPQDPYHRTHGVHMDIFKTFDESYRKVQWRFANTMGKGGTPMADGIHFGYQMLRQRSETRRVLFVLTDGQPNFKHEPVMRYLIRKAKEEGIMVLGVGIGMDAKYVVDVFESHVWSAHISEMPKMLIQILEKLLL